MTDLTAPSRILVVEDEYFIADDVVRALRQNGMAPIGPVASPAAALAALEGGNIDFAVIDINLEGSASFVVASELRRRSIPFLFLTGYDASIVPADLSDATLLRKPYDGEAIVAEIRRHLAIAAPAVVSG